MGELAQLAHAGNRRALNALIRTLRPLVCRWALVWTGDPDEAEDVAQQVLIRVDRSIGDFVARGRVTTWVYRITQNVLRDRERRVRREDRDRKKLELWALETAGHSTGADDDTRWVITLLKQFMDGLSAKQRAAIDLVDLQGYEPIEAAEMLAMNPSTLRVHLLRARRALRNRMVEAQGREGARHE